MKLGFLCPRLPPERCGIGDYSARLIEELATEGHEVTVWATGQTAPSRARFDPIAEYVPRFTTDQWNKIASDGYQALLVQYSSSLYYPRGKALAPRLERFLREFKIRTGKPVLLVAHEMHYPVEWSLPGIGLGLPQFLHFRALCRLADEVVFSYEPAREIWARRLPARASHFHWVPVGSNIPVTAARAPGGKETRLLHFGGMHPTHLYSHIFFALKRAREQSATISCRFVGISDDALRAELSRQGYASLTDAVQACGYLDPAAVSAELRAADLLLAPFMDGVSTRRGSVMAAFEHGLPVLTNLGWASGRSTPWERIASLSGADSREAYADRLLSCLPELASLREGKAADAGEYFRGHFSWPAIARALLAKIPS